MESAQNDNEIFNNETKDIKKSSEIHNGTPNGKIGQDSPHYSKNDELFILPIYFLQLLSFFVWGGGIAYGTYHIYLAAEEHLPWQKDPIMNPSPIANFLNRGRETTDFEWISFIDILFTKGIYWYAAYLAISRFVNYFNIKSIFLVSPVMSFLYLWSLCGPIGTIFIFVQPLIFLFLSKFRSKLVIWAFTIFSLVLMGLDSFREKIELDGLADYYFSITFAWTLARCVSLSFDVWDKNDRDEIKYFAYGISYMFYFPLLLTGPLILYDHFEKHMILKSPEFGKPIQEFFKFFKGALRMGFWILINELIIHYIYFRSISLTYPVLLEINLWALCTLVYWLGQFFMTKYVVMYGVPSLIAETDGLPMPRLPRCVAYIHRYSVLWKDFDRGLYNFLVKYTYLPTVAILNQIDQRGRVNLEIKKLVASLASFVYVYVWHSTSFEVFIWSALNFLGISIERMGSLIKRKIDLDHKQSRLFWDFLIEPICTVPLAAMSIINSTIFCGSLITARVIVQRLFIQKFEFHYGLIFVYAFTFLGVSIRSWPEFSKVLYAKISFKSKNVKND